MAMTAFEFFGAGRKVKFSDSALAVTNKKRSHQESGYEPDYKRQNTQY